MNKHHAFVKMGLLGLFINIILNLFMSFVVDIDSDVWWSAWFPIYMVWVVFLIIGIGLSRKNNGAHAER